MPKFNIEVSPPVVTSRSIEVKVTQDHSDAIDIIVDGWAVFGIKVNAHGMVYAIRYQGIDDDGFCVDGSAITVKEE